jgi:hypothetical protein
LQTEDVYEERIARFLELAEAAQSAADRTANEVLKITYARLAGQWVELAQMAARTISLAREAARALPTDAEKSGSRDRRMH